MAGLARVSVGGLEIAYVRAGAGPPLVFVHGAVSDHRVWRTQIDALAGEYTVVAWDEPGAGSSSDPDGPLGLDGFADVLDGFLSAIGIEAACVCGLSWGGVLALELYRRHPGRVAALVLADTYAGWKGSLPPEEVRARVAHASAIARGERPSEHEDLLPGLFGSAVAPEVVEELRAIGAGFRPANALMVAAALAESDQRDLLPRIDVPVLLVWGEEDARSPLSVARSFERAIPDSRLVVVPGAGHVSNMEKPAAFSEAVRDFCRGLG